MKQNTFLRTLKYVMLTSASIHMILLTIYSIIQKDITYLNYFNILDLDLFFPTIAVGTLSQIISGVGIIIILGTTYYMLSKKK